MQETVLYHMKILLMCVAHFFCLGHDTHAQFTFVNWPVFYTYPDPSHHFYMMGLKDVYEIPLKY